jgi:hypothetical protein
VKTLLNTCTIALLIALAPLPAFYYKLLRFLITIGALLVVKEEWEKQNAVGIWLIVFAAIAILFNPLFPVYLYSRSLWAIIDILCALLFMIKASMINKSNN